MKKYLAVIVALLVLFSLLAACVGENNVEQTRSPAPSTEPSERPPATTTSQTEETERPTDPDEPETSETTSPGPNNGGGTDIGMIAEDATPYNTRDNAVPLGKWVYYTAKNYTSDEYEPFYFRIIGVSRDQDEVAEAIDNYTGIWDFSLSEDHARDIEYAILEYEVYFVPEYEASSYGISIPTINVSAYPIHSGSFKTEGGMTYIGVGSAYSLNINGSSHRVQPGETSREKAIFSILKNYDETEYVFRISWYDGEIVTEKSRELYLAIT